MRGSRRFEALSPIRVSCQAAWAPKFMVPSIACIPVNHCMHKISIRPLSILISPSRHDAKVKATFVSERHCFQKMMAEWLKHAMCGVRE